MGKSTKVDLVGALVLVQRAKRSANVAYVIERARAGKYHDWESDLDLPKHQLIADLAACHGIDFATLIQEVKDGTYDEEPTLEQLEELRIAVGPEEFDRIVKSEKRGQA